MKQAAERLKQAVTAGTCLTDEPMSRHTTFRTGGPADIYIEPASAEELKQVLATYSEAEDLINIGAYKNGSNPDIDYAIRKNKEVNEFLCQDTEEKFAFDEEVELLKKVFDD